ncbi:MAG: hypothetical protein EOO38_30660 [Cytophagaceae bacterium]|nr:MAG: hypothetical protein EOO38_30660 [Cytophagaceae bacterium]
MLELEANKFAIDRQTLAPISEFDPLNVTSVYFQVLMIYTARLMIHPNNLEELRHKLCDFAYAYNTRYIVVFSKEYINKQVTSVVELQARGKNNIGLQHISLEGDAIMLNIKT